VQELSRNFALEYLLSKSIAFLADEYLILAKEKLLNHLPKPLSLPALQVECRRFSGTLAVGPDVLLQDQK